MGCRDLPAGEGVEGEEGNLLDLGIESGGEGEFLETDDHDLNHCRAYADLRVGKQLSRDADIVEYYKQVLERRANFCD